MNTLASTDAALDRFAAEVGSTDPIAVQGGGTRWHLGGIPAENARLIEAPTGIVDLSEAAKSMGIAKRCASHHPAHGVRRERNERGALLQADLRHLVCT